MRTAFESRRRFIGRLLTLAGSVSAVVLTAGGCAPAGPVPGVGAEGAIEIVAARGVRYANLRPDHVAAVRLLPTAIVEPDWSTSKQYE
jgi:hypothetical protein